MTGGVTQMDMKRVAGGLLVQDADTLLHGELKVVTARAPTEQEMADLLFAWRASVPIEDLGKPGKTTQQK